MRVPVLVLFLAALAAGVTVGVVAWRYPRRSRIALAPALAVADMLGEALGGHAEPRRGFGRRLDPESATGLALSLALALIAVAGTILGLLAYLVRTSDRLNAIDRSVAKWGERHASPFSTHVLTGSLNWGRSTW